MTIEGDVAARRGGLLLALLILALIHLGFLFLAGAEPFKHRILRGADSYSRLVQVEELAEHGDWFQPRLPRSNTPYGEIRIWTRAFDIVLWLGAQPLTPFIGFRDALYVWSSLSGTVLHLLAALALFWAARPLLRGEAWICLAALLPFQASILVQFLPGRPDHHAIQAVFFVIIWGSALRLAAGRQDRRLLAVAALACAGALWLSVEALIVIAMLLALVGAAWMLGRLHARSICLLSAGLAALSVAVLAVERAPANWLVEDFDRISVVHCWLLVLIAVFWLLAWRLEARGVAVVSGAARRGGLGVAGALAVGLLLWLAYPSIFGGPMVQVPPDVLVLWQQHIAEFKPAIDPASIGESTFRVLAFIGLAPLAVISLPFLIARAAAPVRAGWYVTGLGFVLYLPLALYQIRWGIYVQFLTMPVLAAVFGEAAVLFRRFGVATRALGKLVLLLLLACGPLAFGWSTHSEPAPKIAGENTGACDTPALSAYLMRPDGFGDRPRRIIGFIFSGPELLYRTRHHVVATPDHRNAEGIADTVAFFSALDDATARAIAKRRGIDLVLFCLANPERANYQRSGGRDLLDRLIAGETPAWLDAVALPEPLRAYRLYRIVG